MTIPEASRLVLEAVTLGRGGEIFVFDMGEPVKIADMARRMIQLAGLIPDEQVKVVFAGLRPGEKLYEELLTDSEFTVPTRHPKIRIAKVRRYEWNEVSTAVDQLIRMAESEESEQVIRLMKKLVPEFISNHSPYEIYDPKN
jgi:FlaA1/EpsC-like NDP-sugar epimerase